ncbi:pentatricopeptide repeat-containing protein [Tripterygium wilfordii]|uniref:Pentatricopeptide repeat-containing protein n=1 Tax=Tripterygium wilfordii TaxID=458696 RepID=A0A7J7DK70_TRIWF|nr:pentatricopeptide repeat-containing protein At1g59720, chloroplastic/mitochondrial [Tripterygium wilfordii]KAF5746669.1 pentatricopeptide repeat-containing protein [Tripterygium wilfordii]
MILAINPNPPPRVLRTRNNSSSYGDSFNHHDLLLLHLNECNEISKLKEIHAQTLRSTLPNDPNTLFIYSRILHFASSNDLDYACRVFDEIENPNCFMWNTLIRAFAKSSDCKERGILLYKKMLVQGTFLPDKYTFPFLLKACAYLTALFEGKQAHAQLLKLGFGSDAYINNSLIHFYASCDCLAVARNVFEKMPERSVVSWNAMIDAFVQLDEFETAMQLFREMKNLFKPDNYTMQSIVSACAGLGAFSLGAWSHAYILRKCVPDASTNVQINNSLVDMYCKCGSLEMAKQVFDRMPSRDVNSWNSMILGFSNHGKAEAALECFECMRGAGTTPNSVTFVGVLSACDHKGMVSKGRKYFDMMITEYKIEPRLEHYGCLVDILARGSLINEALDLVSSMPMKPDVVIWRSLLDACCKKNADVELSEEMARQILELGGGAYGGVYVLLSRVYASASRWDDVGLVRKLMTDNGVSKEPGCSWIEIDGTKHEFFAGDTSHSQAGEIYRVLDVIGDRLESIGYAPDYSQAPMVDEVNDRKKQSLRVHSERLAIALGLLHLKPGMPIRIFKNLRVCNDCHQVTKLISKIFNVEIIVRDRIRFHHFKDGSCSCMDYW